MSKNIFEVLGLKPDHRPTSKIAQLVRHTKEVTVAASRKGPFYVDKKYDGNHAVIPVKGGKILGIFSRVGGQFTNMEHITKLIKAKKMKDGVYYAELYCDKEVMPLQKFQALHGPNRTNGLTDAQEEVLKAHARLAFFDMISLEAFIGDKAGIAKESAPLSERRAKLEKLVKKFSLSSRVHHAQYIECDTIEEAEEACDEYIKRGEEGGVAKGKEHPYVCGHKNFHFMKKVKNVTFDLKCTGYEEGKGKRAATLGVLLFEYGKDNAYTIRADLGKNYTDEDRLELFKACEKGGKKSPVGKIYEVYALEKIGLTNLRQPKVGKLREDKDEADAVPEKQGKVNMKDLIAKAVELGMKPKKAKKADEETLNAYIQENSPAEEPKKEKKAKKGKKDAKAATDTDNEPPFDKDEDVKSVKKDKKAKKGKGDKKSAKKSEPEVQEQAKKNKKKKKNK